MTEEYKKRKYDYCKKYQKQNYFNVNIKLRFKEDSDMIEFLNSKPNKNVYIKQLIAKEMKK